MNPLQGLRPCMRLLHAASTLHGTPQRLACVVARTTPRTRPDGLCAVCLPHIGNDNYNLCLVFGRFPAELGPETRSNESGSKNGAERTQNLPRRPILRPVRDHCLVRTHNSNLNCVTKRRLGMNRTMRPLLDSLGCPVDHSGFM